MKQDMIVILDLGSHENTVLARAIRALGVYSEIYPHDITAAELKALPNVKGIIINGGPNNVVDGVSIDVLPEIYEAGFPVMAAGHDKALCEVKLPQFTDDVEAIKTLPLVKYVAAESNTSGTISFGNATWTTQVDGTTPELMKIKNWINGWNALK